MPAQVTDPMRPASRADTLVRRLADSAALRQRRFELLPVTGPGAPASRPQGRRPGPVTSQTGLADLISSIATCGLLAPILAEELPAASGPPVRLIVAGERRVLSIRRGATAAPENPHFAGIPAIVCPGPLSEEERRSWQLIENLARENLQPGELGAALLFERCAVLAAELDRAGAVLPEGLLDEPDPVARYGQLQRLRQRHPGVGASWQVVLRRLGLQLTPRKARAVTAALTGLPRDISEEMDQHKVALYTRLDLLQAGAGQAEVASELWRAVQQRGRPDLLAATVRAHRAGLTDPAAAVSAAEVVREQANTARGEALRRPDLTLVPAAGPGPAASAPPPGDPAPEAGQVDVSEAGQVDGEPDTARLQTAPAAAALTVLRQLVTELAGGAHLHRFDAGSLRLLATQLLHHLNALEATTRPKTSAA